jgi:hypothetical protein
VAGEPFDGRRRGRCAKVKKFEAARFENEVSVGEPRGRPDTTGSAMKKAPAMGLGPKSLIAVITARLLLREEKQGMTTLRLSFADNFIRSTCGCRGPAAP